MDSIVEILENGRYLSKHRGFLVISDKESQLGRIPLEDVSTVIIAADQASISKQVITALCEQNAAIVFCGTGYMPTAMTLPCTGNFESAHRMRQQINASRPLCKQIWRELVQRKIENQARVLSWRDAEQAASELRIMVRRVRSGDPDNLEAQAARLYWRPLFGPDFTRDRFGDDANVLLNYGYTVLRSAVARSIVGAGLLPALGVHHRGRLNPFALVDDLMEPYRPLVDSLVLELIDADMIALTPPSKRKLASVLRLDLRTETGCSPLGEVLRRLALSLVASYEQSKVSLEFGSMILT